MRLSDLSQHVLAAQNQTPISADDLRGLAWQLNQLFRQLDMNIILHGNHFVQRVSDPRNNPPIRLGELKELFQREYKKFGGHLSRLPDHTEGILRSLSSQINLPFILRWNTRTRRMDLIAKTVMRTPNYRGALNNDEFVVEKFTNNIRQFNESDLSPQIWSRINQVDHELSGKAARAITNFVGHEPGAVDQGREQIGFMHARHLEQAIAGNTNTAQEIERVFAPIRQLLIQQYGPSIELYRVQRKVSPSYDGQLPPARAVLSYTSNLKFAQAYVGVQRVPPRYDEATIRQKELEYERTGRVWINRRTELRREYYKELGQSAPQIYTDGEHITDTDSVRDYINDLNDWADEIEMRNQKKLAQIITAQVDFQDVIWITNRAGQSEFIVRNHPGSSSHIDQTGTLRRS